MFRFTHNYLSRAKGRDQSMARFNAALTIIILRLGKIWRHIEKITGEERQMRVKTLNFTLLLLVTVSACTQNANRADPAPIPGRGGLTAQLVTAKGQDVGKASVMVTTDGLYLTLTARNITTGVHGLHVHTAGRCDGPDFATAGPHWNPTAHQHGRLNPGGAHMGDLPNLVIGKDGRGTIKAWLGAVPVSALMDADGAAIVIHAGPDDLRTDPSGKSGARIACGVLKAS
jgi:superoxide dismutase, Cu-Zn family